MKTIMFILFYYRCSMFNTLDSFYFQRQKSLYVFFQTHGEINLEIDTNYRNKYNIFI